MFFPSVPREKSLRKRFPATWGVCAENINALILPSSPIPSSFLFLLSQLSPPDSQKQQTPKIVMTIPEGVTPQSPVEEQPIIGLIGMGAMGTMYAEQLADAGWQKCALLRPNSTCSAG